MSYQHVIILELRAGVHEIREERGTPLCNRTVGIHSPAYPLPQGTNK